MREVEENVVHLGNTMGDCFENESGICIIKTNNVNGRKRRFEFKHGLNSFRYFAAKQWNSIPKELRLKAGGLEFNKQVRNIEF